MVNFTSFETHRSSAVPKPDQVATLSGQDFRCRSRVTYNPKVCRSGYQPFIPLHTERSISVAQELLITLRCVAQVTNRSFRYTRTQRVSLRLPTVPKHARKVRISVLFEIKNVCRSGYQPFQSTHAK